MMYTLVGTFASQKSKKWKFNRLEFTFDQYFMGRPDEGEDMSPASEAKGFMLVDRRSKETSFYLDTN